MVICLMDQMQRTIGITGKWMMLLIALEYHTVIRYEMPIGSVESEEVDYIEFAQTLQEIGFTNVITEEIVDIDPDTFDGEFRNEILIDGISSFEAGELVPYDQEIKIINHRPFEKYDIKVAIDFEGNWFFDKYDVIVKFDGKDQGTIPHGGNANYSFRVKGGNYKLELYKVDDSSVKGEWDFGEVASDIDGAYVIKGHTSNIDVSKNYEDRDIAVGADEIKMPVHVDSYLNRDNLEVDKELKALGFSNVKRMVYYDLNSPDGEGLTNKVVINGNGSFKKGEVYKKNTDVVVYFRSQKSNDPAVIEENKRREEQEKKEREKKLEEDRKANTVLTINNSDEFAELMKLEDQTDSKTIRTFVNMHKGEKVDFDGCVAYMDNAVNTLTDKKMKTRFDVAIVGGDYNAKRVYGPFFAFENVNFYDMNVSGTDTVAEGGNYKFKAIVEGFNEKGNYIILKPVSTVAR